MKNSCQFLVAMTACTVFSLTMSESVMAASFYSITDLGSTLGGNVYLNDAGQVLFHSQTDSGDNRAIFWSQSSGRLDLGTLDGNLVWADGMNEAGQVFGSATTASGASHAFFWSQSSGMRDLTLDGGEWSYVRAMNAAGQVFGYSTTANGVSHPFLWSESGGMRDFGSYYFDFHDMNNGGQVVGTASISNKGWQAVFWSEPTGMVDLGSLLPELVPWNPNNYRLSSSSKATYISEAGKVLGARQVSMSIPCGYYSPGGQIRYCYVTTFPDETFFWSESEGMSELNTLDGERIQATSMNDAGQVTGTMRLPGGIRQAFFWSESKGFVPLGTLGGYDSYPVLLTDDGYVLGQSRIANEDSHYFLWSDRMGMVDLGSTNNNWTDIFIPPRNGKVIGFSVVPNTPYRDIHSFFWSETTGRVDLGTLGGNQTWADAFNDAGQVIGRSIVANGENHPFVWENGVISDLNSLIAPNSGWVLSNAYRINKLVQILGTGYINGQQHAFLLMPTSPPPPPSSVPEPSSTLSLLTFGAFSTGALWQRKRQQKTAAN